MATIEIGGERFKVVENMGYQPSVGEYAKRVETADGERVAVGRGKFWRFWTAQDRTRPLREAMARGWKPGYPPGTSGQ